jgi:hypothetical protein
MSTIPEHVHALPRVNKNIILPEAVAAWDDESKTLYIGDGVTKGGVEFTSAPNYIKVESCQNNQITVPTGDSGFKYAFNCPKFTACVSSVALATLNFSALLPFLFAFNCTFELNVVTVELTRIPLGNVADEASFVVKFSAVPAQPTQND